jgi:hypothetical protein
MSYSRRQLEALGEPFGSCATRVKPGGYGRIYGIGNDPTGGDGSTGRPLGIPDPLGYGSAGGPPSDPVGIPDPYGYGTAGGPPSNPVGIPDPFGYGATGGSSSNVPNLTIGAPVSTPGFTVVPVDPDKAGPPAPVDNLPVVQVPVPVPVPVAVSPQQQEKQQVSQGGVAPPPGFLGVRPSFTGVRNPFYEGSDTRSDLVNMAYQRLLNRPPDAAGLANYSQEMMRGLTGQGLVSALANSPEFQRTQDFQRAYTSTFRPGYQEFGPSGQYNQPIYLSNYTDYARSPGFTQPMYNTEMMTPQDVGYGFGSFNPFAYGSTNPFAGDTAAQAGSNAAGEGSPAAASGGRIKDDDGITALLKR